MSFRRGFTEKLAILKKAGIEPTKDNVWLLRNRRKYTKKGTS